MHISVARRPNNGTQQQTSPQQTMPPKPKKELTNYNKFMSRKVPEIREKYPDMPHREAFAKAAEAWRSSSENPKNHARGSSSSARR